MTNKEKSKLQQEVVDSTPSNVSGRWLLAPRVGKTKTAITLIKRDSPKSILWVTPSSELAKTDIPSEFCKWRAKKYLKNLTTVTWKSFVKIKGHYDLVILDEEQFLTDTNVVNLSNKNLTYNSLISMTGTPTKDQNKLALYESLGLKVLYSLSINEAVSIGLLSDYEIKVLQIPYNKKDGYLNKLQKEFKPLGKYVIDEAKYMNFSGVLSGRVICQNSTSSKGQPLIKLKTSSGNTVGYYIEENEKGKITALNKKTYKLSKGEIFSGDSNSLALFNRIKTNKLKEIYGKYLFENLEGRVLMFCANIKQSEEISSNFYHSKSGRNSLEKFQSGEIDKIAMVNSGGVGFTYKSLDHLILLQTDSDRNGYTSQKIARTLLKQESYKAKVWILCLTGTQDEIWVESALSSFKEEKIDYIKWNKNHSL